MKLIVGMEYRIKRFDKRPSHWNSKGYMDKWMGKTVEVDEIFNSRERIVKIKDDMRQWNWRESDFDYSSGIHEFGLSEEDFML